MTWSDPQRTEHRRSPRVVTDLWIRLEGVDQEPQLRRGDISATGVFAVLDHTVGEAGSLQAMSIQPPERDRQVQVTVRIIRTVTLDDISDERVKVGVAFEFLPATHEQVGELRSFATLIAERQTGVERAALKPEPRSATTFRLNIERLVMETTWPVTVGEVVQVAFRAPKRTGHIAFEGLVQHSQRLGDGSRYEIGVEVEGLGERVGATLDGGAEAISESVDLIFAELLDEKRSTSRREHLVGRLSRIQLSTLLQILDMEKSTGKLRLTRNGEHVVLFIRKGQIVDAESDRRLGTPREVVSDAFRWREGTFDFSEVPVDANDQFNTSTMGLLLDLAREQDEEEEG